MKTRDSSQFFEHAKPKTQEKQQQISWTNKLQNYFHCRTRSLQSETQSL